MGFFTRSLVRFSETRLFSYDFLDSFVSDPEKMKKKDKSFTLPELLLLVIGYIGYSLHLPYWQTAEIITAAEKCPPSNPSYGNVCKRIYRLNIIIKKINLDAKSLHFSIIYKIVKLM